MKIGIVVYSQTGNTLGAAEKLKEKLITKGHKAEVVQLKPSGDPNNPESLRYETLPDLKGCDAVVLAAPVQAFQLCAGMKAYLPHLPELKGKKVACFVTKGFNNAWTGGNSALAMISRAVKAKGGEVCCTGYAGGMDREKQEKGVEALVEKVAGALG